MVSRTTKRYWGTLALGVLLVLGWTAMFDWLLSIGARLEIREAFLAIGLVAFVAMSYFVTREKGRSPAWVVLVFFVAPSLLVLLILPYDARRRAVINDRVSLTGLDAWRGF